MKEKVITGMLCISLLSACTKECESGAGCDKMKYSIKSNKIVIKNSGVEIMVIKQLSVYGADSAGYAYVRDYDNKFTLSGGLSKSFSKSELGISENSEFPLSINIKYKGSSCGSYSGLNYWNGSTFEDGVYGYCTLMKEN